MKIENTCLFLNKELFKKRMTKTKLKCQINHKIPLSDRARDNSPTTGAKNMKTYKKVSPSWGGVQDQRCRTEGDRILDLL